MRVKIEACVRLRRLVDQVEDVWRCQQVDGGGEGAIVLVGDAPLLLGGRVVFSLLLTKKVEAAAFPVDDPGAGSALGDLLHRGLGRLGSTIAGRAAVCGDGGCVVALDPVRHDLKAAAPQGVVLGDPAQEVDGLVGEGNA